LILGGYTLGVGVRGDVKLNDKEEGVGVGMGDGLDVVGLCASGGGPLYSEPMLENR
jgi:hypothetical protein